MNPSTVMMDVGTWILCLAAIPQLKSVLKNRNDLKGFSLLGLLALFLGLSSITISFILMGMWVSVAAQVLPLVLWTTALYYVWRGKK